MGQRSVRFPDDLEARAVEWCKANDRPFSYVAVRALEQFLGPVESVIVRAQSGEFERDASRKAEGVWTQAEIAESLGIAPAKPKSSPLKRGSEVVLRFKCPDARCDRTFGSGAAVCPSHGRKAVEA